MTTTLLLALLVAVSPQSTASSTGAAGATPAITVRLERRNERFDFHIENPSNVEPGPPVPHFFEQRYRSDNTWLLVNATYRIGDSQALTELGITPRITTAGSDVDTFFQPSGNVITTGTQGDVRMRAFAIRQWIEMSRWKGWAFGATIGYRRSAMDFLPSDRIVTHSRPPSETREPVGGDETTWAHVVDSGVTVARAVDMSGAWQLSTNVEVLPITRARLTISLPLKYPGELIRQDTFGFGARGRLALERRAGSVSLGGAVSFGGVRGYQRSTRYQERRVGVDLFVRVIPR